MKTIKTLVLPLLLAVLASCSDTQMETEYLDALRNAKIEKAKAVVAKVKFKLEVTPIDGQTLRSTFKVMPSELEAMLGTNKMVRSASDAVYCIEPVVYKNDTIMYLVNYAKGWKLYATDKRMPTILAENYVEKNKKAADILGNKAIASWVSDIAKQTKYLANTDEYDKDSESLNQWANRSGGIKRIPYQPVPGEYIYVGREEVSRTPVFFPHVTKTLWHGIDPFNAYTPFVVKGYDLHCPAGCGAVSSAQYMYFLQDQLGYSFNMPQMGSCTGTYNEDYVQNFWQFAKWNLSDLALTDNTNLYTSKQVDNVALALGYIGKQVVGYGENGSPTTYLKVQKFLNGIGIKGQFVADENIDIANIVINRRMPILTGGFSETDGGHLFLIDGAKYDLVEYEDVWRFLEDTTFYDPDRYGVILREKVGTWKYNYAYQANLGQNNSFLPSQSDADDTYYVLTNIQGFVNDRRYFKLEK